MSEPPAPLRHPSAAPEDPSAPSAPGRQLHPLPRGLVELYGLLAVLFVLVPEWMAGGLLQGLGAGEPEGDLLAPTSAAWRRSPELRLACLSLAELRLMARSLRLCGYASVSRDTLTRRLLRRLRGRKAL